MTIGLEPPAGLNFLAFLVKLCNNEYIAITFSVCVNGVQWMTLSDSGYP